MEQMICKKCTQSYDEDCKTCPNCGTPNIEKFPNATKITKLVSNKSPHLVTILKAVQAVTIGATLFALYWVMQWASDTFIAWGRGPDAAVVAANQFWREFWLVVVIAAAIMIVTGYIVYRRNLTAPPLKQDDVE